MMWSVKVKKGKIQMLLSQDPNLVFANALLTSLIVRSRKEF